MRRAFQSAAHGVPSALPTILYDGKRRSGSWKRHPDCQASAEPDGRRRECSSLRGADEQPTLEEWRQCRPLQLDEDDVGHLEREDDLPAEAQVRKCGEPGTIRRHLGETPPEFDRDTGAGREDSATDLPPEGAPVEVERPGPDHEGATIADRGFTG